MREVHEWREAIFEETKHMTTAEHTAWAREQSEKCVREAGYKFVPIEGKPGIMRLVKITN
jgi:hypothetical protein